MMNSTQYGKTSQGILIVIVVTLTAIIAGVFMLKKDTNNEQNTTTEQATTTTETATPTTVPTEDGLHLTAQQVIEQGLKLETVTFGDIIQDSTYPAKLVINSDRQAHVAPSFAGKVESVNVELGQYVNKGQILATVFAPELVNQQADLQIAQSSLTLAEQEYKREKYLFDQGVSAKQDYQRAYNAYQQAQIQVKASQARISALGASTNGRYQITAPISGVISKKDITIGENVQLAMPLFTIEQLDQLWLEFTLPNPNIDIRPQQNITFKSVASDNRFTAQVQTLNTEADAQTGRLQVRAKVISKSTELRPNLMVNVLLEQTNPQVLRIAKTAVQQMGDKNVVFVAEQRQDKTLFKPQTVQLGKTSSDEQWVEVQAGLMENQIYVTQGSFLLKSELEKEQ